MAEIDSATPLTPVLPRKPTRIVEEEERAADERERRQQQRKDEADDPKQKPRRPGNEGNYIDEYV